MNLTTDTYNNTLGHLTLNGQIDALVLGRDYAYKQRDQIGVTLTTYQKYREESQYADEQETLSIIITEISNEWYRYDNAIKIIGGLIADRVALRRHIHIHKK